MEASTHTAEVAHETGEVAHEAPVEIDPMVLERAIESMRGEQNLGLAILAGSVTSLLCAAAWGAITVVTEYQIGWMAVGLGFAVAIAVRLAGKGIDSIYAVMGAGFALLGCALGNLFAGCGFLAAQESVPVFQVLTGLNGELTVAIMSAMFSPMDLLFYGIAAYEGFQLSRRGLSQEDLDRAAGLA